MQALAGSGLSAVSASGAVLSLLAIMTTGSLTPAGDKTSSDNSMGAPLDAGSSSVKFFRTTFSPVAIEMFWSIEKSSMFLVSAMDSNLFV